MQQRSEAWPRSISSTPSCNSPEVCGRRYLCCRVETVTIGRPAVRTAPRRRLRGRHRLLDGSQADTRPRAHYACLVASLPNNDDILIGPPTTLIRAVFRERGFGRMM